MTSLTGRGAQLSGTLDSRLSNVRARDAPEAGALNAEIRATLASGRLQLAAVGRDTKGGSANAEVELPVTASAAPLHLAIARTQPISGRFSIQGEAQPYWTVIVGGEDSLTGQLAAQGTIGGTLAAPSITGTANLQKAAFEDARTGLQLRDMDVALDFTHEAAVVQTFKADDGHDGTITGQGRVDLARGGNSSFTLDLRRFELLNRDEANARASGSGDRHARGRRPDQARRRSARRPRRHLAQPADPGRRRAAERGRDQQAGRSRRATMRRRTPALRSSSTSPSTPRARCWCRDAD